MAKKKDQKVGSTGTRTELPPMPYTVGDKGQFIRKALIAVETITVEVVNLLHYNFAQGVVDVVRVAKDDMGLGPAAPKQFYVDGDAISGGPSGPVCKTHLEWLKIQALRIGATPDAIRLFKKVLKISAKEESEMAAKEKLAKKTSKKTTDAEAGAAPVGGGGKVAKKGKGNAEALAKARKAKAEAGPDTRKIKIVNKENPYRAESNRAASFDALKGAKTVEDYVAAGGKTKYLSRWVSEGRITLS